MKIHVARNGQQLGQFTAAEITAGLGAGTFRPDDLAWWEGAAGWGRLDTAPGVTLPAGMPPSLPMPGAFTPAPAAAPAKPAGAMSTKTVVLLVVAGVLVLMVPIIGLLAAIAIPNFVKARTNAQRHACIANLKQIDGAVQQWALENKKTTSDSYSLTDPALLAFMRGATLPVCVGGGAYTAGARVSDVPRCNIPGHSL